jgi:hypothetical protein
MNLTSKKIRMLPGVHIYGLSPKKVYKIGFSSTAFFYLEDRPNDPWDASIRIAGHRQGYKGRFDTIFEFVHDAHPFHKRRNLP